MENNKPQPCFNVRTAILVDGGFYLKNAKFLFGIKAPEERADELIQYCHRHLYDDKNENRQLYRIFYYDCPPSSKTVYNPVRKKNLDLSKTDQYKWADVFQHEISTKRKVAFRRGELLESSAGYVLKEKALKELCNGTKSASEITEEDIYLDIKQKGVDMRIGLDIASLADKHLVDQIILIAGDSDFVPAAKHARREGIDFVLDPMWHPIKDSLKEHVDLIKTCTNKPGSAKKDFLCHKNEK